MKMKKRIKNIFSIIDIFLNRCPSDERDMLPRKEGVLCTFLNPYTATVSRNSYDIYANFDYIGSDGLMMVLLHNLISSKKIKRISFDMTSMAKLIFECAIDDNLSLYFVGSTPSEIEASVLKIVNEYPGLNVLGYHDGYISGIENIVLDEIFNLNPDIVVVGMGALLQDQFAILLKTKGSKASIYTCGGFFHQTASEMFYYPTWVNQLNIRTFYRIIKERYVLKRLILFYPFFLCCYIYCMLKNRMNKK